jgi:outer membrane autotransporter protein
MHTLKLSLVLLVFLTAGCESLQKIPNSNEEFNLETLSGSDQQISVGQTSNPLIVRVIGSDGQPTEGVSLRWSVSPAGFADFASSETQTNSNGEAQATLSITKAGPISVTADAGPTGSARFQLNSFETNPGVPEPLRSMSRSLDSACRSLQAPAQDLTPSQQNMLNSCNEIAQIPASELGTTMKQIAPEEVATQGKTQVSLSNVRSSNISAHMDSLRGGATGPSLKGLSVALAGRYLPISLTQGLASGGAAGDSGYAYSRWGTFINGNISFGDVAATEQEQGFDFDTQGLTLGLDYRFTDRFVFGSALNYIKTDSDLDGGNGGMDIDGYSLSLYGTRYTSQQSFVEAVATVGTNDYENQRNIKFGSIDQRAEGATEGMEYSFDFGTGYDFQWNAFAFVPQIKFNYTRAEIDSFLENSTDPSSPDSGLMLNIDNQIVESLRTTVGAQTSYAISTVYGVFIPHLLLEWKHEFMDDSRRLTASFLNDPGQTRFAIRTDSPDRNFANVGLGLSATLRQGLSSFIYVETVLDRERISQHSVAGGLRFEF